MYPGQNKYFGTVGNLRKLIYIINLLLLKFIIDTNHTEAEILRQICGTNNKSTLSL